MFDKFEIFYRATFLTGQYPHNSGTLNNSISGKKKLFFIDFNINIRKVFSLLGQCGGSKWVEKETENGFAPKMQSAGYQVKLHTYIIYV